MSSEDNSRIDRREARRAMLDKIFCNLLSCFSPPDDSQRPTTSQGGDSASQGHPVSASEESEKEIINYIKRSKESNAGDLEGLIEVLSQRFDRIAKGKSLCQEPEQTSRCCLITWLNNSEGLKNFAEILSKLIDWASDLKECFPSEPVRSFVKELGKANVATAGLFAVAYVLEMVEQISENNEDCLRLLKEIFFLAQLVMQLNDSQIDQVQTLIDSAAKMAVREATTLLKQIDSDDFCKWWSASINKENLRKTEREIASMYQKIYAHMGVRLLNAVERNNQPRLSRGYPEHAVGMEDAFREVMGLMEWSSPKKAIGVILYGFGGMGKTTLADAVFSRVNLDGYRYSMVEFCENMDLTRIVELQKDILKDLMGTKNIPEFRKHEEGRRLLSTKLEEVPALIYIDNVLDKDNLRQLLPLDLGKAKKVRLLITARDRNVRKACPLKTAPREYRMKGISSAAAKTLLVEQYRTTGISSAAAKDFLDKQLQEAARTRLANGMTSDMEGNSDSNLDHIVQKCGGIPLLLTLVAHELCCAKDTNEVRQVIEELEKMEGEEFGKKLESCFFDKLPQQCISSAAAKVLLQEASDMEGNSDSNLDHIVQKRGGIPLLLTLVADELCCAKDTHEVRQVIEELEKMEGEEFGEKLESCFFVYDKLPQECKEPFLDICSSFEGWDWDTVADILGNSALDKLERRALVTKGTNGVVTVHDVILKICQRKAEGMRFRFTTTSELQKEDQKVEQIRYLRYKRPKHLDQLSKMPSNLKYLEIDGKFYCNDLEIFPMKLLRLPDLRILKLINFEGLKKLPSELAHLVKGLRQLTLSNCKSFEELPFAISNLKSLRVLKVDQCKSLKVLPRELGNLKSLVELDLSNCTTLSQLPEDLRSLSALQTLNLNQCDHLEKLPDNFEPLSSLKVLILSSCKALNVLPNGLGKLTSLVKLDLSKCKNLTSIPESIKDLTSLSSMDVSWCESLKELPNGFCKLSLITNLKLTRCVALEKLPEPFGELIHLTVLKLKSCQQLRKLPESFSQLQSLVHLDLSGCIVLEELCEDFHGLLSLRTLSLDGCENLKKLPTNFHSLPKLQHLDLSKCPMLEAECMNNMGQLKSLAMLNITESANLVKRWGEIRDCPSTAYKVYTGQDLSEEEKENEWKNLSSELDRLYEHGRPEPFKVSSRPPNTILLLMFDGQSDFNHDFPWPLIEETLDDMEIKFEMIYIGKHFHKLPRKVAHKIMGHALDNSDARLLLEKVLFNLKRNGKELWHRNMNKFFAMSTTIVQKEDGGKYLSCWELLIDGKDFAKMEEFLLSKCGKYHSFKKLEGETQESNIHLLRELFVNGCEENCLLREQREVSVEELKGKTILIEIRFADESYDHIRLQCLSEMYKNEKVRIGSEIISIPIGQLREAPRDTPWLVVENPCKVRRVVKYFLTKGCPRERERKKSNPERTESWTSQRQDSWYPSVVRKIEPNGKIAPYKPILSILDRWGPDAYPFTDEKIEELRKEEWKQHQSMSCLEFLLLKSLEADELVEVKREIQGKMTWLLCNGNDPDTHRERTETVENNIKTAHAADAIMKDVYFIYVPPYNKKNDKKNRDVIPVTDSMKMAYFPTEESDMAQEKGKLGLEPAFNLSQSAAIRFWARVHDLREDLERMGERGNKWAGMKKLLESLKFGVLSLTLMDEKGEIVTTKGREIMDIFDTSKSKSTSSAEVPANKGAKELVVDLIKGPEEKRKGALLELNKQYLATPAKAGSYSSA